MLFKATRDGFKQGSKRKLIYLCVWLLIVSVVSIYRD